MKHKILVCMSVLLAAFSLYTTGCNVNQASYELTGVGGTITDSSTGRPVEGVKVWLEPTGQFSYTDTAGFYYIGEINCGSSAGNFFLNYEKSGYDSMRLFTILYAGDTTKRINWALNNKFVHHYQRYGITLTENVDVNSYSNLDAFDLYAVTGGVYNVIDVAFKDSLNLKTSFYLAAGSYAEPIHGLETRFTGVLYPSLTQSEFDTLSRIDVGSRPIIPDIDFPSDRTFSYSESSVRNEVYGFYLKGRRYIGYAYDVFGLIRINNFYRDPGSGQYKIVVDVKVNRHGENIFR